MLSEKNRKLISFWTVGIAYNSFVYTTHEENCAIVARANLLCIAITHKSSANSFFLARKIKNRMRESNSQGFAHYVLPSSDAAMSSRQ